MVQALDHEAVDGDMDQESVEGAVDGASDERSNGSGSSRTNVQAMSRRRY